MENSFEFKIDNNHFRSKKGYLMQLENKSKKVMKTLK